MSFDCRREKIIELSLVMLSGAKHLWDYRRDPSLALRVTCRCEGYDRKEWS
jgi:hypothetical protein